MSATATPTMVESDTLLDNGFRSALVTPYPNQHITDLYQAAGKIGNWTADVFYFRELPAQRAALGWVTPEHFRKLDSGIMAVRDSNKLDGYDHLMFLGISDPMPIQLMLAIQAARRSQRVTIATEGRKNLRAAHARHSIRLSIKETLFRLAVAQLNRPNVEFLSIGDGSTDDFQNLHLTRPRYFRFGFSELTPDIQLIKKLNCDRPLIILSIGQLIPRKNHIAVCHALQSYQGNRRIEYVVCGAGGEEQALRAVGSKFPENCSLTLPGACSDSQLATWLSKADIFVMPSLYDGWGVALNHAIQAGLPAIVSRNTRSGPNHLVQDGVNGYVYDSLADFKSQLNRLIEDADLRSRMAVESSKIALLWSFDEIASRLSYYIRNNEFPTADDGGPLVPLP